MGQMVVWQLYSWDGVSIGVYEGADGGVRRRLKEEKERRRRRKRVREVGPLGVEWEHRKCEEEAGCTGRDMCSPACKVVRSRVIGNINTVVGFGGSVLFSVQGSVTVVVITMYRFTEARSIGTIPRSIVFVFRYLEGT